MIGLLCEWTEKAGKLTRISINDSFFIRKVFPKPPKMSRHIVKTNYLSLSPLKSLSLVSIEEKNDLMIWYVPSHPSVFQVPDALLLYRALLSRSTENRIAVFHTFPKVALVISDGKLLAQTSIVSDIDDTLKKLRMEHRIERIDFYENDQYARLIREGYDSLTLNHWRQLLNIDIPNLGLLSSSFEKMVIPASIMILLLLGYHYFLNDSLKKRLDESKQSYQSGRGAMIPIKHKLDEIKSTQQQWNTFVSHTLKRPDALNSALPLVDVCRESNVTLKYLKVSDGKVETVFDAPSSTKFLKAIVSTHQYEDVKLEFSRTDPLTHQDNAKIIAYISSYDINGSQL